MLATLDQTDELLLLCNPDVPTLKNVRLTLKTLELLSFPEERLRIVLNRASANLMDRGDVECGARPEGRLGAAARPVRATGSQRRDAGGARAGPTHRSPWRCWSSPCDCRRRWAGKQNHRAARSSALGGVDMSLQQRINGADGVDERPPLHPRIGAATTGRSTGSCRSAVAARRVRGDDRTRAADAEHVARGLAEPGAVGRGDRARSALRALHRARSATGSSTT